MQKLWIYKGRIGIKSKIWVFTNSTFFTPLNCALKAFIFALKDSADAFVLLFIK